MEKEVLLKLLAEHLLSSDPEFKKAYKENPPIVEETLAWQPGELIVGELSENDKYQLLSRYLNNISVYLKNEVHLQLRIEKLLTFLLEAQGVDVQAKFREDAKKQAELVEQRIEETKKAIKESVKN